MYVSGTVRVVVEITHLDWDEEKKVQKKLPIAATGSKFAIDVTFLIEPIALPQTFPLRPPPAVPPPLPHFAYPFEEP